MARRLTKEQVISIFYYDVEGGFGSTQETYKKAKQQDPEISLDDVEKFMTKQPNKQIKGYRGTNSFSAPFARYEYQIDKRTGSENRTHQERTKICISGH